MYKDLIESAQKQILLFELRGLGWDTHGHLPSNVDRLRLLNLHSVKERRTLHGVVASQINHWTCKFKYLLGQIQFSIPVRSTRYIRPINLQIL